MREVNVRPATQRSLQIPELSMRVGELPIFDGKPLLES
jgi:hypothetical protein